MKKRVVLKGILSRFLHKKKMIYRHAKKKKEISILKQVCVSLMLEILQINWQASL